MNSHELSQELQSKVIHKIFDIPYAEQSPSQILDIWYPNEEKEIYPVVVHIHGGGFCVGGHREDSLEPMLKALERGYVLVSMEYRKSDEARFPAMVYDAKAALRFLKANAATYKLDPDRIALWGPSSGGWLAVMTALTDGNPAFEDRSMGHEKESSRVQAVVDWCGPCGYFNQMDEQLSESGKGTPDHGLPDSPEARFMGAPLEKIPELVRMASPCTYVNREMPPVFIMHGSEDEIVPVQQSVQLAEKIRNEAGEDKIEFHLIDGVKHHGRVWWHDDFAAEISLDFIDRVLLEKGESK